jgi:thiol-disulfide isomerase/thioredoxin
VVLVAFALLRPPSAATPPPGQVAPDFSFVAVDGSSHSLSSYQGHPVVLWFITTFCPSCSDATSIFAQQYAGQYSADGVLLIETESFDDLGQPGPAMSTFASDYGYSGQAGWIVGTASAAGTTSYNPGASLDVYYVIDSHGILLQGPGQGIASNFGAALQAAHGQ